MKRHNFKGQGVPHGNHRTTVPGAIGACATPSRASRAPAWRGQSGAGTQVTALNLEVVSADAERELVLVRGAVPGARGSVVVLRNSVKAPTNAGGRSR